MPRTCTICAHEDRAEINEALLAGEPYRSIAKRYEASESAVYRHKLEHLPVTLTKAQDAAEVAQADDLLEQVRSLQARALTILGKAEQAGDLRTALTGVREARACLELLAKLSGELQQEGTVNVLVAPEWLTMRHTITMALEPYPQARTAVLEALSEPG